MPTFSPQGYFGDATDERQGCQKIECEVDEQCAQNQRCDNYMCKSECRFRFCIASVALFSCLCINNYAHLMSSN